VGPIINSTLTWKDHIHYLTSRLNKVCYAIRTIKLYMSLEILKMFYFSYVHSIRSYGIVFWGNSSFSNNIFKIQKRILRIITNTNRCETCRPIFKQLQILPLPSQYIFSLLMFAIKNMQLFLLNSNIHGINTRIKHDLHLPSTNLTLVQKGVLYTGSKMYNHLPFYIKNLSNNIKYFKSALKIIS
jgi:hypothetical protein